MNWRLALCSPPSHSGTYRVRLGLEDDAEERMIAYDADYRTWLSGQPAPRESLLLPVLAMWLDDAAEPQRSE